MAPTSPFTALFPGGTIPGGQPATPGRALPAAASHGRGLLPGQGHARVQAGVMA